MSQTSSNFGISGNQDPSTLSTGYNLQHSAEALEDAIQKAYDTVVTARYHGAKIRIWAVKVTRETDEFADWARSFHIQVKARQVRKIDVDEKMRQMSEHELKILQVIQRYMDEINRHISRLERLNPPLQSDQLEPFLITLEKDKRQTIIAFDTLIKHLEKLIHYKVSILHETSLVFSD